jgi:hypothetical protein
MDRSISIQTMLDEIDVRSLGLQDWIERAEKGGIKRDKAIIEVKRARVKVLRTIKLR